MARYNIELEVENTKALWKHRAFVFFLLACCRIGVGMPQKSTFSRMPQSDSFGANEIDPVDLPKK